MDDGLAKKSENDARDQPVQYVVFSASGNGTLSPSGTITVLELYCPARENANAGNKPSATTDGVIDFEISDDIALDEGLLKIKIFQ